MYSSFSTHLVRPIKAENPDNQVIIRVYSYPEPVQMPQARMDGNQWMQPASPQPRYAPVQEAARTYEEQYLRQPQEAAMYNFDKDCEDDREMLREDPYAEYPDFPKECRMTDMAQMDMVYC